MTAPAFTPGPWEAQRDRIHVAGKGVVATANNPWNNEREREANARLIAAAPEMLNALQIILNTVPRKQLEKAMNLNGQTPYDIAQAALAKARGEQ